MKLADLHCGKARPSARIRKMSDGGGLYLQVNPTGSKLWRMSYRFGGKHRTLSFGPYPEVSL